MTQDIVIARAPRFLLFAGQTYYPVGGANDFRKGFHDLQAAIAAAWRSLQNDGAEGDTWWHVFDVAAGHVVACGVVCDYRYGGPTAADYGRYFYRETIDGVSREISREEMAKRRGRA